MKIKEYWNSKINWKDIEGELNKYPSINKVFPVNILKDASNKTPFYCHPIFRWFLYKDPSPLRVLDNIINEIQSVCGIEKKKEFLGNPRNESWKFWSTLSELSLALHLKEKAQEVIFLREGKKSRIPCAQRSLPRSTTAWKHSGDICPRDCVHGKEGVYVWLF